MNSLLAPPLAFIVYMLLVGVLTGLGRLLAGEPHTSEAKSGLYASGEAPMKSAGAPGYRPFFVTALFFAVLHLGVVVLATGDISGTGAVYLGGLIVVLLMLVMG